jgi:hypothetical protein
MGQRGAFILGQVYNKQVTLTHPVAVSTSSQETGYYNAWDTNAGTTGLVVGGYSGNGKSWVDKIDFSNDTVTTSVISYLLTGYRYYHASVSNNNYNYVGGGAAPIPSPPYKTTSIERISFSNGSSKMVGNLSVARYYLGTVSTSKFGWFAGGYQPASPFYFSTIERLDFSNDNVDAGVRNALPVVLYNHAGTGNDNYGWLSGSNGAPALSSVYRIDFSNDFTAASSRGVLSTTQYWHAAVSNTTYGWFAGGTTAFPSASTTSKIDRINFSNDLITASSRGVLSQVRMELAASGNNSYAWFSGGYYYPAPFGSGATSMIDRLDYANDTAAAVIKGPLSNARPFLSGGSNYTNSQASYNPPNSDTQTGGFGWVMGGQNGVAAISTVQRIDFSNDSVVASTRGVMTAARGYATSAGNANYGWVVGGSLTGVLRTWVDRIDFSNDLTISSLRSLLPLQLRLIAGSSNASYGWFSGGISPTVYITTVHRIDFANDLASILLRGPLVQARYAAGTGNANYGWIGGGSTPATVSSVERIVYSSDLISALTRGSFDVFRTDNAAASNTNYGWFAGGLPGPLSSVSRVDFSNDTVSAIARGPLTIARTALIASSNQNYGWYGGNSITLSSVDRIDFSNDSATAVARGPLIAVNYRGAATSNYVKERQQPLYGTENGTYGWIMHGNTLPAPVTFIDRIDFSSDTGKTATRGVTSLAKLNVSATSNNLYAWFSAGRTAQPAPAPVTTNNVEKLDFANDLSIPSIRANMPTTRMAAAAVGTSNFGWISGGVNGIPATTLYSTTERIDYSADLSAPLTRGSLTITRNYAMATGNANYGWVAAGSQSLTFSPTYTVSTTDRIDFSNDSVTATARGSVIAAVQYGAATSTGAFGWFAGGYRPVPSPTSQAVTFVSRHDFSNDNITASTRGPLSLARYGSAASGSATYGWFTGGFGGATTIDRIEYSNDTVTASVRGAATTDRSFAASGASNYVKDYTVNSITQYNKGTTTVGTGAGTFGWFIGGQGIPFNVSTVDRVDYSNDTTTASTRGSLPQTLSEMSGAGNANYAWVIGGRTTAPTSLVHRIDYSNDSVTVPVRTPIRYTSASQASVSNNNFGWTMGGSGGFGSPTSSNSTVQRIEFLNDTASSILRGSLSVGRYGSIGLANAAYGWALGGILAPGGTDITVDRINFSNDSTTAIARAPLVTSSGNEGGAGNSNYGWSTNSSTNIVRIDYSSDTASPLNRSTYTTQRSRIGATGNADFGYFTGGFDTGPVVYSIVDRITYATDTVALSVRGNASVAKYKTASASNYTK